ncbi:MAG: hypothetical protein OEM39_07010 [Acidimicrobiia bacterium]|nr:hypothetical protein [Acidimicrobiia bacterium]
MSETDTPAASLMGKAIVRGVLFGLPAGIVGLTLAVFVFTENTLVDSFATAILPGVLLGVFAGGFAGMAMTME